jgi:hypothetical protein
VKAVNTTITKGKAKRFRGRPGVRSDKKKAYVTLEEGNTIDVSTAFDRRPRIGGPGFPGPPEFRGSTELRRPSPDLKVLKQTEDRKHGTQVVQADDAWPARAGSDRPFGALERPPGQGPHRGFDQDGWTEQHRTRHDVAQGRGRQAPLPRRGFQAHASSTSRRSVERIEYDPNRTAFIALVRYADGELAYILAPQRLAVGDRSSPAPRPT